MTDPANILSGIEAVLAAEKGTICKCGLAKSYHDGRLAQPEEYHPRFGAEPADALRKATYPEALAVVRAAIAFTTDDYTWDQERNGDPGPALTRALAAFLAKAQEYVPE